MMMGLSALTPGLLSSPPKITGTFSNTKIETVRDNEIIVEIRAGESELAALNSHLVSKGIKVFSFGEEKTDLEDLFMKISDSE